MRTYYVSILTNRSGTPYVGVTGDAARRLAQHRERRSRGFTTKYRVDRLVFVETLSTAAEAIACEKRIKGWTRAKKVRLIEQRNPRWVDLSGRWDATGGEPRGAPERWAHGPRRGLGHD